MVWISGETFSAANYAIVKCPIMYMLAPRSLPKNASIICQALDILVPEASGIRGVANISTLVN